VLAAVGLAGCPGGDTDTATDGTPVDSPTATPTETDTPTDTATATSTDTGTPTSYVDWFPAPSAIERFHYETLSVSVPSVLTRASDLGEGATRPFRGAHFLPGIDRWDRVRQLHVVADTVTVTRAAFDRETVETAFRESEWADTERTHRGYTVFESDRTVAAVGDDAVVSTGFFRGRVPTGGQTDVETVVDAAAGETDRYVDANPDFGRLTETVALADVFRLRTHDEETGLVGSVAAGLAYYIGPEETDVGASFVFEADRVDEAAVDEWAEGAALLRDGLVTTRTTGRVVTAGASVRTSDIGSFTGRFPDDVDRSEPDPPNVTFGFDYDQRDDGTGVLEATHAGGDTLDPEELFVRGEGFTDIADVDQTGAGPWQGTTSGSDGGVVAGDAVAVGVTSDYDISIVWESAVGSAGRPASAEGPDA